jgi:predicted kinase
MSVPELRLPRTALVLLVGPSGCGKSHFARRHFRPTQVVSSDECRRLVSDDAADQRATREAFSVFYSIIRGRMALGRLTVADATNLQAFSRQRLRELAARHGRATVALVFDVPLETCLARAAARHRRVDAEVVRRQHERFAEARAQLASEGYHATYVVRPPAP